MFQMNIVKDVPGVKSKLLHLENQQNSSVRNITPFQQGNKNADMLCTKAVCLVAYTLAF